MNIVDGPPHSVGGLVAVGVGDGVSVGAMVEVGVIDEILDGVAVGASIGFNAPQPFTIGRSVTQQSNPTILLK
jgi:hypothetical protein